MAHTLPLDLLQCMSYNLYMAPRTGRPRTGITPNVSIRLNPDVYQLARIAAVTERKAVGKWLEEAILEKLGWEGQPEEHQRRSPQRTAGK